MTRGIAVSGHKESGKTTVVEGLVEELVERGYEVGTVKHIPIEGFTLDQEGTDTWRHAQAGSSEVVALSPDEVTTLQKRGAELEDIFLELTGLDFVVLEGFGGSEHVARIVVAENKEDAQELEDEYTIGFVGEGTGWTPTFSRKDASEIADFVEEKAVMFPGLLDCGDCGHDSCRDFVLAAIEEEAPKEGCSALRGSVELEVDGKRVALKSFVQDLIAETISGLVSSLKDSEGKKIRLEVERDGG